MRCAKCDGRSDERRCTDCAAAYVRKVREHCAWDHSVLMLALTLKIKERSKL
jgi:hypothetical protein